jgi:hypothetical protein
MGADGRSDIIDHKIVDAEFRRDFFFQQIHIVDAVPWEMKTMSFL